MHPSDYVKKINTQSIFIFSLFLIVTLVLVVTYFVQKGSGFSLY